MKNESHTDISFIIVNSPEKCCLNRASVFRNLSLNIPVLQDLPKVNIWKRFQAGVDDMLIFDKYIGILKNNLLDFRRSYACQLKFELDVTDLCFI